MSERVVEPLEPGPVGPEERWNDSMYVFWRDPASGVSGWVRVAQQPNMGTTSTLACVVVPGVGRYRYSEIAAFGDDQRSGGRWRGNGLEWRNDGGSISIRYSSDDCELDLTWSGFHDPVDFHRIMATFDEELGELNAEHVEQSGSVRGTVRVGGAQASVDAMGHRDHSWGSRDTHRMLAHRWMIGTVGPELSWSGVTVLMDPGVMVRMGYVVRDGSVTPASSVDVTLATLEDGLSYASADSTFRLLDGSSIDIGLRDVVVGCVLEVPPVVMIECSAAAHVGGVVGVGNCEVSNNITGGTSCPPVLVSGGAVGQGLLLDA